MDNSSKNRQNEHLGVNKMGKSIRKSPLHQPNFNNNPARQQPQPQVYNISKNDFRNIVQQLTGSPSQEPLPRPPPQNPQKPQSMRLQRIRPPPLMPINRPPMPRPVPAPVGPPPLPYNNASARPPVPFSGGGGHPSPLQFPPFTPGNAFLPNTAESPISAYMRYLQTSMTDPSPRGNLAQPPMQPPLRSQNVGQLSTAGILPNPTNPANPAFPPQMMNPHYPPPPNFHPPRVESNAPALLPSPTSQFLLPSPSGYLNLVSPRSPYPLLSPGIQFSPLLSPNFLFSPLAHSGILGPGPPPQPSPGLAFPLSPSGFFPLSSPKWREQ